MSKQEIGDLLQSVILQRDLFSADLQLEFWKSAYNSVEAVNQMFDTRLRRWKGTEVEKTLKKLKKCTNKFIRTIKKHGTDHGSWTGASDECSTLLNSYRSDCTPMFLDLAKILNESDSIRLKIEEVLTV
ncbi:MAG: hypothetical protein ACTSYU_11750 [Promethearchaeota archaeon]